ncbi:hypothetical protein [Listeria booriae]|uniref:hypothetical protein n=1 Tax=Listeria booriae TaxID=1552123 RepID=UPI00162A4B3E|nr:hypothetical protein [Listeria booriae]MBC2303375.1 hypothetical protein [Listeria booriae]
MAKTKRIKTKDIDIGGKTYTLTFSDADVTTYLEQTSLIPKKVHAAQSFDESVDVLKNSIELFLGVDSFEQVFNDCEQNILNVMNELFMLLEVVNNEIYPDEEIEIPPEPEIEEDEIFPD